MATRDIYYLLTNTDTQRLDYDGSNNVIYVGNAQPGSLTSTAVWRIQQLNYTGTNVISILYPAGSPAYSFIWDNRTTLTYT